MSMKVKFGKRTTSDGIKGNGRSRVANALAFLLIVAIVVLFIYITTHSPGAIAPVGALGMLGDPFRTTRKMRVPFRSRVGHRERRFMQFGKFAWGLGLFLLALYFILQVLEAFKAM